MADEKQMSELEKKEAVHLVTGARASGVSMAIREGYRAIGLRRQDEVTLPHVGHVLEVIEALEVALGLEWEAQEKKLTLLAPDSPRRLKRTPAGEVAAMLEREEPGKVH